MRSSHPICPDNASSNFFIRPVSRRLNAAAAGIVML
jgi:hypothetical protein